MPRCLEIDNSRGKFRVDRECQRATIFLCDCQQRCSFGILPNSFVNKNVDTEKDNFRSS